ncbi:hypothetical protein J416_09499 [Gracilibacillus halophilus YIM-C55.5]|uniref:Uncharacterized protein n=1 Tax=Gracilibacillus halophilus YIM-C55.5 TaxID=1308866 RepID=N4WKN0_9BACI|nr:HK97-gp10 family putative phage morphogenesis protein [Gracilibacillus halophilus]ENH96722.1 hypothetical protein J416_09499 [Gracilibacillus halophilus YIM-C55.5]
MSVKVTGMDKMLSNLEKELGQKAVQRISDAALTDAAEIFLDELKRQFESWSDKGYSIEEMTLSKPFWEGGTRTIKVYWKGPHDRYRIIHLNEFGTVKNPNPDGKGSIARAIRNSEKPYHNAIRRAVERGI